MKMHELQDQRLDEIGRKLLETGRMQDDELEKIVSAPHLFDAVKARIKAEREQAPVKIFSTRAIFSFLSFLSPQNAGAAFAALLLGVSAMGGFYLYSRQTVPNEAAKNTQSDGRTLKDRKDAKPAPVDTVVSSLEAQPEIKPAAAVYHQPNKNTPAVKANFRKKTLRPDTESGSDGEFYPLTFTGNSDEIMTGAQVVRVELPRSSLFSMGVDLPDENRAGTVKADLLISSDGVTRGFRLVR